MRPTQRTQITLFVALAAFTALNLTPIIWAFLTSIKLPVDAFAVPPKLIFEPTFKFHYEVWVEKEFWRFLINSAIISVATVCVSVPIGTMAAFGALAHAGIRGERRSVRPARDPHVSAHLACHSILRDRDLR